MSKKIATIKCLFASDKEQLNQYVIYVDDRVYFTTNKKKTAETYLSGLITGLNYYIEDLNEQAKIVEREWF